MQKLKDFIVPTFYGAIIGAILVGAALLLINPSIFERPEPAGEPEIDFGVFAPSVNWLHLAGSATTTDGVVFLATSTDPISKEFPVAGADKVSVLLSAKASTSAPTLNIVPYLSRNCIDFYSWGGALETASTSPQILATTTFPLVLPTASNVATSTTSFSFRDVNAACMRLEIGRGTGDGLGNALLSGEIILNN